MPTVTVKRGEPVDKALRRLKKKMSNEGVIKSVKRHRHYEKPSDRRRRLKKSGKRR